MHTYTGIEIPPTEIDKEERNKRAKELSVCVEGDHHTSILESQNLFYYRYINTGYTYTDK